MKNRLILSVIALVASVAANAQIMPDSTVQIVAYWSKGDRVAYDCTNTTYDADENDNRSNVNTQSETRIFEVLDAREDGYTLRLSYKNVFSPKPVEYLTPEEIKELSENYTITFNTDQYGSVTGIVNAGECRAVLEKIIDGMVDRKWKEMDTDVRKTLSKQQLTDYIKSAFCSDEVLALTVSTDISPFFTYHGTRLDTTQVYSYPSDYTLPIGGNQKCEVETKLWVDEKLTDTTSAVICTEALADKDVLIPIVIDYTIQYAQSVAGMTGQKLTEDDIAELSKKLEGQFLDMTMNAFSTTEIHLSSGWPVQWFNTRVVGTVGPDRTVRKVFKQTARLSENE